MLSNGVRTGNICLVEATTVLFAFGYEELVLWSENDTTSIAHLAKDYYNNCRLIQRINTVHRGNIFSIKYIPGYNREWIVSCAGTTYDLVW